jgi:hypothetical protein
VCAVRAPAEVLARIAEAVTEYKPAQAEAVWRMQKQALAPQFRDAS